MPAEQLPQRRIITGRHANDQPVVVHASLLRREGDRFTNSTKNLRRNPDPQAGRSPPGQLYDRPRVSTIPAFSEPLTTHELPDGSTKHAPAWPSQSPHGDRSCSGGAPARRAPGGHRGADLSGDRWLVCMSGRHLGPQEPGQLPGDRGDDHVGGVLASGQPPKAAAQPQLGRPRPGHHLGIRALLALVQLDPDRRAMLQGPGRPRPAGRAGGRCHTW
jgi:hypothetical protein